jgi:FkbM family methyltransferase
MAPLGLIGRQLRAEAIEALSCRMTVETRVPGGALKFFAPSPLLQVRAATVLTKEPDMIDWIDGFGPDVVFWDIGANIGVFSLYAGLKVKCKVLSFEPSAANFFVLSKNIRLNRLNELVTAYCVALSGTTELGALNVMSGAMGEAMTHFGKIGEVSRYWIEDSEHAVHGMVGFTVDDFIARFNPSFPTHIKIDVDGLEWPILQGSTRALSDRRVLAVMVELSITQRDERERAIDLLEESGLRLISCGASQGTSTEKAANHLFRRK